MENNETELLPKKQNQTFAFIGGLKHSGKMSKPCISHDLKILDKKIKMQNV